MASLTETTTYDAGVYQLEVTDPVQGGSAGVSNSPLKNLANRTNYLKKHVDDLESGATIPPTVAPKNSPALTGSPTTPTPPLGDNDTSIPTTEWVQSTIGGILSKNVAGGSNVSLTTVEAGNGILIFTGAITANIAVIVPNVSKYWVVANRTTGNFSVTVKTAAGTGVVIPQGLAVVIYSDTVNVYLASSAGQTSFTPYAFTPTVGTTSLAITGGYTPGSVLVEKNGALLPTSDYAATNGTSVLVNASIAGDTFTVYAFSSFSIANAVQKSGDTMAGALALFAGSTAPAAATGDRSSLLATMAAFSTEFTSSLGINGWQKLPSGLIIQWGNGSASQAGAANVFPITFPTATLSVQGIHYGTDYDMNVIVSPSPPATGFTAKTSVVGGPYNFTWLAVGY